jgi:hypothetical protein
MFNVACCQSQTAFLFPGILYARHAKAMWLFFAFSKQNRPIVELSVINHNIDTLVSRDWNDVAVFCAWYLKE